MDDEWDTDPDFQAKDDSNGDGSGTVAVSNPFLKPVETVTQDPYGRRAEYGAPLVKDAGPVPPVSSGAKIVKRANSFDRFGGGGKKCVVCGKTAYAA